MTPKIDTETVAIDDDPRLSDLAGKVWRNKWIVIAATFLGLIGAVFYLRTAPSIYTAELRVTASSSSNGSGSNSRLAGLASLAGLSNDSGAAASPFDLYLEALTSREVASALAKDDRVMRVTFAGDWDATRHVWHEPKSLRRTIGRQLKTILGIPIQNWHPPGGAELQAFIKGNLSIERGAKSPVTVIRLDHGDPEFAVYLLKRTNEVADSLIKMETRRRAVDYSQYLSDRLRTVTLAEHREALATALGEQERSAMLASSQLPYAATALEHPAASMGPTKPRASSVLAFGILLGLAAGTLAALARRDGKRVPPDPADAARSSSDLR